MKCLFGSQNAEIGYRRLLIKEVGRIRLIVVKASQGGVSALREGDEVTIKWRACNNNQYLNRAGLYKDEVYLVIRRTVRGRLKKFTYHVATSICENNTAKMVKHTSTPKSIIGDY